MRRWSPEAVRPVRAGFCRLSDAAEIVTLVKSLYFLSSPLLAQCVSDLRATKEGLLLCLSANATAAPGWLALFPSFSLYKPRLLRCYSGTCLLQDGSRLHSASLILGSSLLPGALLG